MFRIEEDSGFVLEVIFEKFDNEVWLCSRDDILEFWE